MAALRLTENESNGGSVVDFHSGKEPNIHFYNGLAYERQKVIKGNKLGLRLEALRFVDTLGYNPIRSRAEVLHNVRLGCDVVIVREVNPNGYPGNAIGVATEELRKRVLDGEEIRVLFRSATVIDRKYQKRGIAKHVAVDSLMTHRPHFVTGKIRTWRIPRVWEEVKDEDEQSEHAKLVGAIHPIDGVNPKAEEIFEQMLTKGERRHFDLKTSVYNDAPHAQDPTIYLPPYDNPNDRRIYDAMIAAGADPANGKGLRYLAEVNQEVLEMAALNYHPSKAPDINRPVWRRVFAALLGLSTLYTIGASSGTSSKKS